MGRRPRSAHAYAPSLLRLRGSTTIALSAALFVAVFALRVVDHTVSDGETLLFVVPVGLLAIRFGPAGGLAGAAVGSALTVAWALDGAHVRLTPLGYVDRILAYMVLGVLIGSFVKQRRQLEAQLLRYFDQSLEMLWTSDLQGRLLRVNPAWERVLGTPVARCEGAWLVDLVHPHDRDEVSRGLLGLNDGSISRLRMRSRFRTAPGQHVWVEWSAHACPSEGAIHGVAHDVTTQVRAEQQLANEAKRLEASVEERTRDLNEARAETLQLLAVAAEYRDDETSQHTERVGALVAEIAGELGLSQESVTLLREAAPLHDVGKLAIPDRVLLKQGRLDGGEQATMNTHVTLGARLLYGSRSPTLQLAGVIAESHHEWWDGSGYPKGLSGTEIPLVGRIVAVADVFDALTHDRPYKPAWPVEQALAMIRRSAGSQFDPDVVAAFLRVAARVRLQRTASVSRLPSTPSTRVSRRPRQRRDGAAPELRSQGDASLAPGA